MEQPCLWCPCLGQAENTRQRLFRVALAVEQACYCCRAYLVLIWCFSLFHPLYIYSSPCWLTMAIPWHNMALNAHSFIERHYRVETSLLSSRKYSGVPATLVDSPYTHRAHQRDSIGDPRSTSTIGSSGDSRRETGQTGLAIGAHGVYSDLGETVRSTWWSGAGLDVRPKSNKTRPRGIRTRPGWFESGVWDFDRGAAECVGYQVGRSVSMLHVSRNYASATTTSRYWACVFPLLKQISRCLGVFWKAPVDIFVLSYGPTVKYYRRSYNIDNSNLLNLIVDSSSPFIGNYCRSRWAKSRALTTWFALAARLNLS